MQDIVESLFEIVFLKNSILSVSVFALIYFTLDAFHDRMYEKERETGERKYNRKKHSIDAVIKVYVVTYIALFLFGVDYAKTLVFPILMVINLLALRALWFSFFLNILRIRDGKKITIFHSSKKGIEKFIKNEKIWFYLKITFYFVTLILVLLYDKALKQLY